MEQGRRAPVLVGAAIFNFVGVFSMAISAIALRYGENSALFGLGLGCIELVIAMVSIATVAQVGNPSLKTQGMLLVGSSISGACIVIACLVGAFLARSSDWVYESIIEITGYAFVGFLILLFFVGIATIRDAKERIL